LKSEIGDDIFKDIIYVNIIYIIYVKIFK